MTRTEQAELWTVGALFASLLAAYLVYIGRVLFKGKARFERVEKQGGSVLLGKGVMQGAYWFFDFMGRGLISLRVTPNQLSWASLAFGLATGFVLAFGHFGFAALLATVSAVLDSLDGLVARRLGTASDAGEVLDATIDRYVEFFFLGGLAIYYREIPILLILVLSALVGSFMVSYSTAKAESLSIDPPKSAMRRPERAVYLTLGAALAPISCYWWEVDLKHHVPVPIGYPLVLAIALVAVISNVSAVERMAAIAREVRRREAEKKRLVVESLRCAEVHASETEVRV